MDDLQPANILNEAPGRDGTCPALQGAGLHGCHGTSVDFGDRAEDFGAILGRKKLGKTMKIHDFLEDFHRF